MLLIASGCKTTNVKKPKVVYTSKYSMIEIPKKKITIPPDLLEPVFGQYPEKKENPLLQKKVFLAFFNVPFGKIVDFLSKTSGLSILLDEGVDASKPVTVSLGEVTLKQALDTICRIVGYYYTLEKGNVVHIKYFVTRYYNLDIPKITVNPKITLTGRISGIGSTGGTTGGSSGSLGTSTINLKFENMENENPYKKLRELITPFLSPQGKLVIDDDTGLVIVRDRRDVISSIDKIIKDFKEFYKRQVDIEVTMIEVKFKRGEAREINWQLFFPKLLSGTVLGVSPVNVAGKGSFIIKGVGSRGKYFRIRNLLISFLSQYGQTVVLSSPRIRVLNGYSAMVVAGITKPYWRKNEQFIVPTQTTQQQTVSTNTNIAKTVNWEKEDYLQGVLLGVKPRIDRENNIYLQITSMVTDIVGESASPDGQQTAPVMVSRRVSTLLKVRDGDTVIMSGLRSATKSSATEGIPGLEKSKVVGSITSSKNYSKEEAELVVVLRVKLVK